MEIVVGSYHPEYSEGELVGKTWHGDAYLISIRGADGEISDYFVKRSISREQLENYPLGSWVEVSYFVHEEKAIPVADSITIYDN